jgi:hypothetical protein
MPPSAKTIPARISAGPPPAPQAPPPPPANLKSVSGPAAPAPAPDPEIEAHPPEVQLRVANLAAIRAAHPGLFNTHSPRELPGDIQEKMAALGITGRDATDILSWWDQNTTAWRRQKENRKIAERVINLARCRERWPDLFDDDTPVLLPHDIITMIAAELGISKTAAKPVVAWWTARPIYRLLNEDKLEQAISTRVETLALLRELAPSVFDADKPLPLALGTGQELVALGFEPDTVGLAIGWWVRRRAYRAAVAAGGMRYDLNGHPVGEISDEYRTGALPLDRPPAGRSDDTP